jgi:flagellar biosynthesis protein FlhG
MVDQAEKLRRLSNSYYNETNSGLNILNNTNMRIFAVASGKGGVGKTSIVVNLAISLKRAGKKVMIMDADLGLANVDILMDIIPKFTLYDVFKGRKSLHEIVLTGPEGIKIIPGGSGINELANISAAERELLITQLQYFSRDIDYFLIDSGAGVSKNVLGFLTAADDVIIVLTPEPTSITDAYGIIKILSHFKLQNELYLIVNMVKNNKEAKETARKIIAVSSKYLNIKINKLGFISNDASVGKSIRNQKPFVIANPQCKASKEIDNITQSILQKKIDLSQGTENFFDKLLRILK